QAFEHELRDELAKHEPDVLSTLDSLDTHAAETLYDYESPARARLKHLLTNVLPIATRNAAIQSLFERHVGSSARWAKSWYLDWEEVVELHRLGHTIGAHGYSHEPLTRLSAAQRRQDLQRVAYVLRNGLGSDIRPLSFPYGRFDDDARNACRQAGFVHAFTTQQAWIERDSDPLALPRVDTINVSTFLKEHAECTRI
ncbi:MAG: polysaccharide deacetylase family protein, partial [Phycisphaerae bacterium]